MTHWRNMMDDEYLHAADLMGRDQVVTIDKVTVGQFPDFEDPKSKRRKPVVWFRGKRKPLGINSTNARAISKLLGTPVVEQWIGKAITIYPTTTKAFGEEWECIRVRNKLPTSQQQRAAADAKPGEQLDATAPGTSETPMDQAEIDEIARREREDRG